MMKNPSNSIILCCLVVSLTFTCQRNSAAQDEPKKTATDSEKSKEEEKDPLEKINKSLGKLRKLPEGNVWINLEDKLVVIDGKICMTRGPLEMFACPPNTKEHESVVQVEAKSFIVHTALLMVGAKSGKPVNWEPKYTPASGTKIEIMVHWLDKDGKHQKLRAQEMIRDVRTKKAMKESWVFAGSEFYTNPNTKIRHYLADGGEMICVSNFTTAMMDIPVESSQSKEGLIFEALSEKIPPIRTRVRLVLKPIVEKESKKNGEEKAKEKKKDSEVG